MSARRTTTLTRLLLAMTGIAGLSATASAQPDILQYHGDPAYGAPVGIGQDYVIAHVTIDGEHFDITECQGVRQGLLDALRCAGYDAWCEGYTIVVDTCHCVPRIRFHSHEFRLSVREGCDELRLWLRPRHHHHDEVLIEGPVVRQDRYRVEPPAIIFDEPGYGRGKPEPVYTGGRGYDGGERDERGYERGYERDDRGREAGRREGGPREYGGRDVRGVPSFETQRMGIGLRIEDDDVRFDLGAGFSSDQGPSRRR